MSFSVITQPDIERKILRDISNIIANANVGVDSDYAVRAAAEAAAIEGIYQYISWVVRQIFPDTADEDIMEVQANLRNVKRKAGNLASGSVVFTGTASATVPVGTLMKNTDGLVFVTTAAGVIGGDGNVTLAAAATAVGVAYNLAASTKS